MAFPSLLVTSSVLPGLRSVMGTPWGPFPSRPCLPGQAQAPPVDQMTQRAGTTFPQDPALSRCSEDAELSGRAGGNSSERNRESTASGTWRGGAGAPQWRSPSRRLRGRMGGGKTQCAQSAAHSPIGQSGPGDGTLSVSLP